MISIVGLRVKDAVVRRTIEKVQCIFLILLWGALACIHVNASEEVHEIASASATWLIFLWGRLFLITATTTEIEVELLIVLLLLPYHIPSKIKVIDIVPCHRLIVIGGELLKPIAKIEIVIVVTALWLLICRSNLLTKLLCLLDSQLFLLGRRLLGQLDGSSQLLVLIDDVSGLSPWLPSPMLPILTLTLLLLAVIVFCLLIAIGMVHIVGLEVLLGQLCILKDINQ